MISNKIKLLCASALLISLYTYDGFPSLNWAYMLGFSLLIFTGDIFWPSIVKRKSKTALIIIGFIVANFLILSGDYYEVYFSIFVYAVFLDFKENKKGK